MNQKTHGDNTPHSPWAPSNVGGGHALHQVRAERSTPRQRLQACVQVAPVTLVHQPDHSLGPGPRASPAGMLVGAASTDTNGANGGGGVAGAVGDGIRRDR